MTDNKPNQPEERLPQWGEAVVPPFGDTRAMYDIGLNQQAALQEQIEKIPEWMSRRWAQYRLNEEELLKAAATLSDKDEKGIEAHAAEMHQLAVNERTQVIALATALQQASVKLLALYGDVGAPSAVASLNEIFDHPENGMFSQSHIDAIAEQVNIYNNDSPTASHMRSLLFGAFILRARAAIEASVQAGMSLEEAQQLTNQYVYVFNLDSESYIGIEGAIFNTYDIQ